MMTRIVGLTGPETATDRWLATLPALPPLTDAGAVAERLLLLLHYGIDWQNAWVARYRSTYWSNLLPDRVVKATYRRNTLPGWWDQVSIDLCSAPRNAAERREVVDLLRHDARPVLQLLREQTQALLLRVRLVSDAVRESHNAAAAPLSGPATRGER